MSHRKKAAALSLLVMAAITSVIAPSASAAESGPRAMNPPVIAESHFTEQSSNPGIDMVSEAAILASPFTMPGELTAYRALNAKMPIMVSPSLTIQAKAWADSMARSGVTRHDPRLPKNQGENVASFGTSPAPVTKSMNMWRQSAGHRANMLSDNYGSFGAACSNGGGVTYCVQRFQLR